MKENLQAKNIKEPFEGFGFTGRYFYVEVTNLAVRRYWSGESGNGEKAAKVSIYIHGKGFLETDSVCIIGSDERSREFSVTLRSDEFVREEWKENKGNEEVVTPHGDSTPELRIRKRIFDELDKTAPTAILYFVEEDWEVGLKSGWGMECKLPLVVLRQIEEDLIANKTQNITLAIKWEAGLIQNEHAPPSVPTTWGLFKIDKRGGPEPLRGHASSFS